MTGGYHLPFARWGIFHLWRPLSDRRRTRRQSWRRRFESRCHPSMGGTSH